MNTILTTASLRLLRVAFILVALVAFAALGVERAHAVTCSSTSSTTLNIHAIQSYSSGTYVSPYQGCEVTTTGVVIAVLTDGFYIENPSSSFDSDTCTAEGIYVYTPSGLPSNAVLQNSLTVTGIVQGSNNSSRAGTEIYIASPSVGSNVVTAATGQSLPSAISSSVITAAVNNGGCSGYTAGSFGQWLPFQGMRVNVPSSSTLLVTQGTGGTVTPASQAATSNGQFWAVMTTTTRPFRAAGIDVIDPAYVANSTSLSGVAIWNANPQLMLVDSTTLGGTALDASAGTEYTGSSELVGIVDYHVSSQGYTGLLLTASSVSALSSQSGATPVAASERQSTDQLMFATLELNGLTAAETNRTAKLANAVVNYMHSPDVLAVQNATPAAINLLLAAVTSASGPGYALPTESTADANGMVNAFLVNTDKFDGTPTAAQALAANTWNNSAGTSEQLFGRSPLVMMVKIPRKGISDYKMYLVNASLLDRSTLAATATSTDARTQREQQAELLTTQVLEPLETAGDHVLVLGGLNSFEFSDGYVDTTGILDGSEAASGTVWLYDANANTTALLNSTTTATNLTAAATNPATSRYTFVESGSAEQLDHILYTREMGSLFSIDYARIGADFPVSSTYNTATVARATTHDGLAAYFTVPYPTTTTVTSSPNPSFFDQTVTFTATVVVTGDTAGAAGTPDGTVTFTDSVSGVTLCASTLASGAATCTYSSLSVGTHTITASYAGSETGLGYQASSGTASQVVNKDIASVVVTSSVNPSYLAEPVTFSAAVTAPYNTPTGTVTFYDGTISLGTGTLAAGTATYTASANSTSIITLSVGTHSITALYGGDGTHAAATAAAIQQVVLPTYATTSTLSCTPLIAEIGATISCTDGVAASTGQPSGTITYYDGSAMLGTATVTNGSASFTLSSLAVGAHSITASYAENDPYLASTSNAQNLIIESTFTITATPTSTTLYTGEAATYTLTVTPGTGFTLDVALACSGVPVNTACTMTPATVTGGSGTATMVVQTTAPAQTTAKVERGSGGALLAGLLVLLLPRRWRKRGAWWAALLLGITLGTVTGCGGSGSLAGGTPAGSYNIVVTGTSTISTLTIAETTTVGLNVKSMF